MIRIVDKKLCVGCAGCVQICPLDCISFNIDKEGFSYPMVDESHCVGCNKCDDVCPVIHPGISKKPIDVFASKNIDDSIRKISSSGGLFTLLSECVLNKKGVVFGAGFNKDWNVVHSYCLSIEGLSDFRGSKYVQSEIGKSFIEAENFLSEGKEVLFSGTPCQISGLKLYLGKNFPNLTTIDFVCHGVPSPKIWQRYIKEFELLFKQPISNIRFRDKSISWRSYMFSISSKDKTISELVDENKFLRAYLKNLTIRPSCYACPTKSQKSNSDITIGDYWGIESVNKVFSDDKGVSLIMINSHRGLDIYNSLVNHKSIQTTYNEALQGNYCIENSVSLPENRKAFFEKIDDVKSIHQYLDSYINPSSSNSLYSFLILKTQNSRFYKYLKGLLK